MSRRLSGLAPAAASAAIGSIVRLPADIEMVSLQTLGPPTAELLSGRLRLNLLSLEAIAAARLIDAELCLATADRTGAPSPGARIRSVEPSPDNGHTMVIALRVREESMPQVQDPLPETMPAGEFKAKCLAIMDRVAESGGQIIITKYGHPVAALVPCPPPATDSPELWGSCRGEITVTADLTEPTIAEADWISDWEAEWDEFLPETSDSGTAQTS